MSHLSVIKHNSKKNLQVTTKMKHQKAQNNHVRFNSLK